MVRFAYGRKGAKLTCGAKPDYAVEEEEARLRRVHGLCGN